MAAILTSSVLLFSVKCVAGSLDAPGFQDDPTHLVESFVRLAAGLYQFDFSRSVDASELELAVNPAGFDAMPPSFNAAPIAWPLYVGVSPDVTGLIVAIGQVGVGLTDHDFQATLKQIRIVA